MWRVAGICFDHFHMGDLLRYAHEHPKAEIVALCDEQPERTVDAQRKFAIPPRCVWSDVAECLQASRPDIVILCPSVARHVDWVEKVAGRARAILLEKPFAQNVADADRMIAATKAAGTVFAVNWPMVWEPCHVKCHELIISGAIGEVQSVRYYGGNRGPLYHGADKTEHNPTDADKAASWFYRESEGGGSLRDYLGYGTTLGTWFNGGQRPKEVIAMWDHVEGGSLEVDEHSVVVARYATGLSSFETRWGTLSDPWVVQPEPRTGFIISGAEGTLSSWDYDEHVTLRTRKNPEGERVPSPPLAAARRDPIAYMIDCLENNRPVDGPLDPAVSRIGQEIIDAAIESAQTGKAVAL